MPPHVLSGCVLIASIVSPGVTVRGSCDGMRVVIAFEVADELSYCYPRSDEWVVLHVMLQVHAASTHVHVLRRNGIGRPIDLKGLAMAVLDKIRACEALRDCLFQILPPLSELVILSGWYQLIEPTKVV